MRPDPFSDAVADAATAVQRDEAGAADAVAAGSPLARLRAAYERRQQRAELHLPVPGWDETLVARVRVPDDEALKTLAGEAGTPEWTASFVATAVAGLFTVDGVDDDGNPRLEPLLGAAGLPLRFDHEFGTAIGAPDVDTPRSAVLTAFTTGGGDTPPILNVLELADFAAKIDRWLTDTSREIAEAIVPGR